MSTEIPPPPPPPPTPTSQQPAPSPTQITGQQSAPSTSVPMGVPGMPPPGSIVGPGQTNTLALVSFITALAAPFGHLIGVGGITLIIVSIVTGHMARSQIRRTGEGGGGFALAGLIISYAHLVLTVLVFIFFFGLIIAAFSGFFGPR